MKIIIANLPKNAPQEFINKLLTKYQKRGIVLKTEIRGNQLLLYYIENN